MVAKVPSAFAGAGSNANMAIFTKAEKARQIALWQEALEKVSRGQEYTMGTRRLRRADLPEIRSTLDWLDGQSTVEDVRSGQGLPRFLQMVPGRGGHGGC
ncbi:hypothetical protein Bwad006_08800 [Bilophila wadsworthia]